MEIEIIEEKENPFLERKELTVLIRHYNEPTPSKQQIIEEISKKYDVDKNRILINYVLSKRGKTEAIAKIKIYNKPIVKEEVKENETQDSQSQ